MSERKPYCFVDGETDPAKLELLQAEPVKVWACQDHPRSPYLTEGCTDD